MLQTTSARHVSFGLRNSSFVSGYVSREQVQAGGFDTLLSGLLWLVRDGEVYVDESLTGDKEDMDFQGTGSGQQFVSVVRNGPAV